MTENTTKAPRRKPRSPAAPSNAASAQSAPAAESKIASVTRLLRQEHGAGLDELVAATSWQPHTTRAALTGLRKKGHTISKDKVDGVTRYTISTAARS